MGGHYKLSEWGEEDNEAEADDNSERDRHEKRAQGKGQEGGCQWEKGQKRQ